MSTVATEAMVTRRPGIRAAIGLGICAGALAFGGCGDGKASGSVDGPYGPPSGADVPSAVRIGLQKPITVVEGGVAPLTAQVLNAQGQVIASPPAVVYTIRDTTIAAVDSRNYLVAKRFGSTVLIARVTAGTATVQDSAVVSIARFSNQ